MMTFNYCRRWTVEPVFVNSLPIDEFLDIIDETYYEEDLQNRLDKFTIKTKKGKNGKVITSIPIMQQEN